MKIISITIEPDDLNRIDSTWPLSGCSNRSEFMRDAALLCCAQVRRHLEREAEKEETAEKEKVEKKEEARR